MKTIISLLLCMLVGLSGCTSSGGGVDGDEGELRIAPKGKKLAVTNVKLGIGYMQKGSNEYALEKFRRAIEIDSDYPDAHYAIALLYEKLKRNAAARKHFEEAVSLNPSYSDAYNAYAAFLCRQKEYDAADKQFQNALKNPLYRHPNVARINAGICSVNAKLYPRAEAYFRKVLQTSSKQPIALYQMAKLNYQNGRYLQARAYVQRFMSVTPPSPQALWLGVQIERELNDRGALASYELSLRKNFPDSEEAYLLRESSRK